jgi:flagellar biosynthetic protein FliR
MSLQPWLDDANSRFVIALLIFTRFSALLLAAPLVGGKNVPPVLRLGMSGALAMILMPLAPRAHVDTVPVLIVGLLKEVAVGGVLGWIASLFFASVQMAGEWLDLQSGFQAGQLLNPGFDTHNALLGQFSYLLAGLVFLGTGGHEAMLRAAVASMKVSPPGSLHFGVGPVAGWATLLVETFWIAIQLAAPLAAALFLAEVATGLLSRALPHVNVMVLTLPMKAILAVFGLALALPMLAQAMAGAIGSLDSAWAQILRPPGP